MNRDRAGESGSSAAAAERNRALDPIRRVRQRVLLWSAPLVFIFAITDRLLLRGAAFWIALSVRALWGATLVGSALWLPRLGDQTERRLLIAVGGSTPLFFGVLVAMTGGTSSPLFHFIVAMPLVVAVVLQDQPWATLAATITMLGSGVAIVARGSGSPATIAEWAVQAAAMGSLAVYASTSYRRLRVHLQAAREAELAASERARLFQAELTAREQFLSVASHELKTPMTSLLLQVESLGRSTGMGDGLGLSAPDRARLSAKHGVIARQTRRLATLVDTLLDASRIRSGRLEILPEDADLVAIVKTCLLAFEEDARRVGSALDLSVGRTPIPLATGERELSGPAAERIAGRWDPRRLEQIVGNLVANALRYGAGGAIQVRLTAAEQQVTIAVRDHGIGIAAADHARIFERFEQVSTDRAAGGMGLGLWITQQLVEAMGGRVLLTSALGAGSTFTIELPRETTRASVGMGRPNAVKSAS